VLTGGAVVLGRGRAGTAVAAALSATGASVTVLGRDAGPAAQARAAAGADVVVLAVPDDVLAGLATELGAHGGFGPDQLVVHLAGSRGLAVLSPAAAAGARVAAVHPAMALTGGHSDLGRLRGAAVGVTAGPLAQEDALALARCWGGVPVLLDEHERVAWHAALTQAATFGAALALDSAHALAGLAVPDPAAVLRPLVEAAVGGALSRGGDGLTGPAARADAGTVAAHLSVLDAPHARRYGELSALTAGLAAASRPRRAPLVVRSQAELAAALALAPRPRALVMTLGALHEGHSAHLRRAREAVGAGGSVVLSVYLNPLQFGSASDLDAYPRTLDADLATAAAGGVDVVFAPDTATVYPDGPPVVRPDPGPLGAELEGAARPGHFAGVLTVVHRMLRLVAPDVATFGEKDHQQMTLVRRLVADLGPDVEILEVPTVREPDGLARSSRNSRLDAAARESARALPRALWAGAAAGDRGAAEVLEAARAVLSTAVVRVDYLVLRAPDLGPAPATGPARLLVAAEVGGTRLLDTVAVQLGAATAGGGAAARLAAVDLPSARPPARDLPAARLPAARLPAARLPAERATTGGR